MFQDGNELLNDSNHLPDLDLYSRQHVHTVRLNQKLTAFPSFQNSITSGMDAVANDMAS